MQLGWEALMLNFPQKDRSSLACQMLQSGIYYLMGVEKKNSCIDFFQKTQLYVIFA